MSFLSEELEKYIADHSEKTGLNEQNLREETLELGSSSGMMSGDSVGNFLKLIIKINNCKNILEIGTFTGYSALKKLQRLRKNIGQRVFMDLKLNSI